MGYRMDKSDLEIVNLLVQDKLDDIEEQIEGSTRPEDKAELLEGLIGFLKFQLKYIAKLYPGLVEEIQEDITDFEAELEVTREEVEA